MTSGTSNMLWDVWGNSGTDVFAVGQSGIILRCDGSIWSMMTSGMTDWLHGIWGSSDTDVFASGDYGIGTGTVLRYNGTTWSDSVVGASNRLIGIWGSSGTDVFSAGDGGTIYHYNGSSWSPMTSGTTKGLMSVWGSSGTDVFAVGQDGIILYYGPEATLITLSSFTATPSNRSVILKWTTESEIDNAGFNLYRAESEDGDYVKINGSLISAEGSATQGATYQFIDNAVKNRTTYFYKLEDIDIYGTSTMHGPVSATPRRINVNR
jgi:photosystem II stability/assembly factor-like uncharacterized protein